MHASASRLMKGWLGCSVQAAAGVVAAGVSGDACVADKGSGKVAEWGVVAWVSPACS